MINYISLYNTSWVQINNDRNKKIYFHCSYNLIAAKELSSYIERIKRIKQISIRHETWDMRQPNHKTNITNI